MILKKVQAQLLSQVYVLPQPFISTMTLGNFSPFGPCSLKHCSSHLPHHTWNLWRKVYVGIIEVLELILENLTLKYQKHVELLGMLVRTVKIIASFGILNITFWYCHWKGNRPKVGLHGLVYMCGFLTSCRKDFVIQVQVILRVSLLNLRTVKQRKVLG